MQEQEQQSLKLQEKFQTHKVDAVDRKKEVFFFNFFHWLSIP
jgi:hypothetical protein